MKNIVLFGLLSTVLFIGCSSKEAKIIEPQEVVKIEVKVESKESLRLKAEKLQALQAEKALEERRLAEEKKIELKKKLDREAVTNSDKKLKAQEVLDYKIDENTPLILKNQSEEKAYE